MRHSYLLITFLVAAGLSSEALAWDPLGDITHPDRILKNIDREVSNAGQGRPCEKLGVPCVDVIGGAKQILTEAEVQTAAPVFENWLISSSNTSRRNSYSIPDFIRQKLSGFYGNDILNSVTYKIGDNGVANLGNLSIKYGDARAVTLIDVIVFSNESDVDDPQLWVHELKHVEQFRDWGVRDFSIRYLRELRHEHNPVENDARDAEARYQQWKMQQTQNQRTNRQARDHWPSQPPPTEAYQSYPPPAPAQVCSTPYGGCQMQVAIPAGATCFCQSYNGPIYGIAK